jgi:hypothetical protein
MYLLYFFTYRSINERISQVSSGLPSSYTETGGRMHSNMRSTIDIAKNTDTKLISLPICTTFEKRVLD